MSETKEVVNGAVEAEAEAEAEAVVQDGELTDSELEKASGGGVNHSDFSISKRLDKASVIL